VLLHPRSCGHADGLLLRAVADPERQGLTLPSATKQKRLRYRLDAVATGSWGQRSPARALSETATQILGPRFDKAIGLPHGSYA
jgi:hypothetical protein